MIEYLVAAGASVECTDEGGMKPLLMACKGDKDVVEYLVAAGASVHCTGKGGETPLLAAASCGNTATVEYLVAA
jgi:ankyrin repeat protein